MASLEPSAAAAAAGDAASQSAAVQPIQLPTPEENKGQEMMNNCAVRSVLSGVMGGGLGVLMGLFFGALENPIMSEEMTARQQIVYQAKQMGRKSMSHAKTFAVMGLIFSAAECVVEKVRAKHDITNSAVAGCVTGGALAAKVALKLHVSGAWDLVPSLWRLRNSWNGILELVMETLYKSSDASL